MWSPAIVSDQWDVREDLVLHEAHRVLTWPMEILMHWQAANALVQRGIEKGRMPWATRPASGHGIYNVKRHVHALRMLCQATGSPVIG